MSKQAPSYAVLASRLERALDTKETQRIELLHLRVELAKLKAVNAELVEALTLLDQAENGPWNGAEQARYLATAKAKARAALSRAQEE